MVGSDAEAALIERARNGDEAALQALFRRHERQLEARVRAWMSPAVQRKVSAADVMQEAYIIAHRRIEEFVDRGEGSFGQWLAQIARHKAQHAVRRYAGTDKRDLLVEITRDKRRATANVPGEGPSPSEHAARNELEERMRRVLPDLPEDYRTIIRLRQEEHLTMQEAADRMGRSKGAVEKLYSRALARLAKLLDLR